MPEIQRVVLLREGKVMADGPKEEILQIDRLSALFGVKVEMTRSDGHYYVR